MPDELSPLDEQVLSALGISVGKHAKPIDWYSRAHLTKRGMDDIKKAATLGKLSVMYEMMARAEIALYRFPRSKYISMLEVIEKSVKRHRKDDERLCDLLEKELTLQHRKSHGADELVPLEEVSALIYAYNKHFYKKVIENAMRAIKLSPKDPYPFHPQKG